MIATPSPGEAEGAVFDPSRVDAVLKVFSLLRHTQARWAGRPLTPDPWQVAYILAPVFGWVRYDEDAARYVRVVRNLYVDVPRKNGKSTLAGGIAVYLACADGEAGAQVITAATSTEQARFVFDPIKTLATRSPALAPHVRALTKRITHPASGSYIGVVSNVAEAQHGANVHGGIIDELHVHKTATLVETIESGTGSRDQPLIVIITTADSGTPGTIYARKRGFIEQLSTGVLTDPTTYGVVWSALESEDPHVETTWRAANPGYGISPTKSYMRSASSQAQQSPADLASFLRLHLGRRTKQETKYLDLTAWRRGGLPLPEADLVARECYGGLDLASTSDLCALAWLFPDDLGGYDTLIRLWTPEANLPELDRRTAGEASVWVADGALTLTDGDVADYDVIAAAVITDLARFSVLSLGFDPWNASSLVNTLGKAGANLVPVRQGYGTLSAPLKEIQRLTRAQSSEVPLLRGVAHPSVVWQVDNLAVTIDPAGNVKPDKAKAADKIDAVSAITTAMSEAMIRTPEETSIYEERGLESV